jgi:hypothetical protein
VPTCHVDVRRGLRRVERCDQIILIRYFPPCTIHFPCRRAGALASAIGRIEMMLNELVVGALYLSSWDGQCRWIRAMRGQLRHNP